MPRTLHVAILRNASLLVPASARAEWLAEWSAELWYVDRDATAFCLGSFRDASWLRLRSFSARRIFSLDSPLRCVLLLVGVAALVLAFAVPSRGLWLPSWSLPGTEQFVLGFVWMYLLSLLVLLTLNPLGLGEYPANQYAPSLIIRLRRWAFLAMKIVLLVPIPLFVCLALESTFPPAPWIILFGWIFGFRWVLADQRRRCPVCLHFLSNPVELGGHTHMVFQPHGTELSCARGHGSLYVPDTPTSWCARQEWEYTAIPASGK